MNNGSKTLIVTGASRGVGAHIAERATNAGYRVVGLSRTKPQSDRYEARICNVQAPEEVMAVLTDLKRDDSLVGVINAAGIASMNLALGTPAATAERVISVNLLGTIYVSQTVGRFLVRRRGGRIINFSTIAVPLALSGEAVYVASKAGVEAFTRVLAREMADHGVTVNAISPGPIDTRLIAKVDDKKIQVIIDRQMIRRQGTVEDVWNAVEILLSDNASMITGQILSIGGV